MLRKLCAVVALAAMSSVGFAAEPRAMTNSELDQVVAGGYTGDYCCYCPPEQKLKGNNGWGNGADPNNSGSYSGATAASKTANGSTGSGINQNPTTSSGR